MPIQSKVVRVLPADVLQQFHRYALQPTSTIDGSLSWLKDRGYSLSWSSVQRYLQGVRQKLPTILRPDLSAGDRAGLMVAVNDSAAELTDDDLYALAIYAAFLVYASSAHRSTFPLPPSD